MEKKLVSKIGISSGFGRLGESSSSGASSITGCSSTGVGSISGNVSGGISSTPQPFGWQTKKLSLPQVHWLLSLTQQLRPMVAQGVPETISTSSEQVATTTGVGGAVGAGVGGAVGVGVGFAVNTLSAQRY